MSKTKKFIVEYHSFFGDISVEEIDVQNNIQNYSIHASLDYAMLDHMKAVTEPTAAN